MLCSLLACHAMSSKQTPTINVPISSNERNAMDDTTIDKESLYAERFTEERINLTLTGILVGVILLVFIIVGIVWYFIAKRLRNSDIIEDDRYDPAAELNDDYINDPTFNDPRYFRDRSVIPGGSEFAFINSPTENMEPEKPIEVRKLRRASLDGEEEDNTDDEDEESVTPIAMTETAKPVGGELSTARMKTNNPLWAAQCMGDTDDPFNNDFEEELETRLYRHGAPAVPKLVSKM